MNRLSFRDFRQYRHNRLFSVKIPYYQRKSINKYKLALIITRETLGPTHWTGNHKQAALGPGDTPSNSLASPYQIAFMASSIVQTMEWRN